MSSSPDAAVPAASPLVSIIVTSYNYGHFIATAIDSALGQTYPHLEVVVVDNCSTDGTVDALRVRYGEDPRVRIFVNEANLGELRNSNRGFEHSRGEFVLWLSADDWMYPRHVARLYAAFERDPAIDLAYSSAYFADAQGRVYARRQARTQFPLDYVDARDELIEMFVQSCPLCWPATLFRRSVFLDVGLADPDGIRAADWDVQIRIAAAGKRFAFLRDPSMAIRVHGDQGTGERYHASGDRVREFVTLLEHYDPQPCMERIRGRELGVIAHLDWLVEDTARIAGRDVFDVADKARFAAAKARLEARAAAYEPARVRERTISAVVAADGPPQRTLRTLAALAAQTHPNWQAVVIDHGEVPLAALLEAHPARERIAYVRSPAPLGPGRARNLGLRCARGEYLTLLDAGDTLAPDHFATLADAIARSGGGAAATGARLVLERSDARGIDAEELGTLDVFRGGADPAALGAIAHALPLGAVLFYRRALDRAGTFGESVPLLEDFEFLQRLERVEGLAFAAAPTYETRVPVDLGGPLGRNLGSYTAVLDAVYATHPVAPEGRAQRASHRAAVERAIGALAGGSASLQTIAELLATLAGRAVFPKRAA